MRYLVLLSVLLAGCSNLQRVDREEFMRKADAPMGTMQMSGYIGCSWDRAYVQDWQMGILSPARTKVLWTPLKDLTAADREKLQSIRSRASNLKTPSLNTPATRPADALRL